MDAIVIAGGLPGEDDPLYPYTQGRPKALVDIAGKPMIQWILDALDNARGVGRVVVVGLDAAHAVPSAKTIASMPDQGGMLQNILAGTQFLVESDPKADYLLSVSADIPAIRAEMVDWTITAALESEHDVYYSLIPKLVMETRFPGSRRSFVRLRDQEVCGGDLNVFRASMVNKDHEIWERIISARKNAVRQAALIGFDTLFLLLLRRLTTQGAVKRVGKRLGLRGRALISPYAELGMDVDKPYQLEILRADLASRTYA
jgi:GTP:adenosylcobinamide-phosphate guanylyltransferase